MTFSAFLSSISFLLAIYLIALFVITYLRFVSGFMGRARFTIAILVTSALFFLAAAIVFFINRPPKDKIRISVLPMISERVSDDHSWLAYAISDQANFYLQKTLAGEASVFPLEWIWEAIDADSAKDENYLQDFARRIKLGYAAIGKLSANSDTCTLEWRLLDIGTMNIVKGGRYSSPSGDALSLASALGKGISEILAKPSTSNRPQPQAVSDSMAKWQTLASLAFSVRDYGRAVRLAETAYKADTTYLPVRNLLARANIEFGIQQERAGKSGELGQLIALKICERTINRLDSTDAEAHRIIGKYYILRKMWNNAESHLHKAFTYDPDNARIYYDYSHLHASRIKTIGYRNEEAVLRRAIALNPCYEAARLRLADLLYFNKWPKRADLAIDELLAIHPRSIEGLLFRGKMAVGSAEFDRIVKTYNRIIEIDPRNADAYYNLGVFYFNSKDVGNAERFFERAVQVGDSPDAHLYLGYIYQSKGLIDKAIDEYRLRIRHSRGLDDPYADEARKRLFELTKPDSSLLKLHGSSR